ncbi:hypothetical protein KY289_026342 [Solanum tuberosum]|nr:hypothetical protein KY289_026342 [Solanum tuberosum]
MGSCEPRNLPRYTPVKIIVVRKKLLGSAANALPDIDPRVMSERFTLNRSQQLALITPITREEVHLAMKGINITSLKEKIMATKGIDDNKCDGLNAFFSSNR